MTAPARPQHYADAAAEHVAADRAAVTALVGSYRDTLARGLDPLTALACVAGAAYQTMCSRQASKVLAAAVQMLAEMQAAAEPDFQRVMWCDVHGHLADHAPERLSSEPCKPRLLPVKNTVLQQEADRAGVDRHWGPLAATGGELP